MYLGTKKEGCRGERRKDKKGHDKRPVDNKERIDWVLGWGRFSAVGTRVLAARWEETEATGVIGSRGRYLWA